MKLTQQLQGVNFPKLCIGLLLATTILSCQKELKFDKEPEQDHNLILKFRPVVQFDSIPLVLGKSYNNFFKEPFTPTAFKFYIHNFEMINTDSAKVFRLSNDKYYLIDFADTTTLEIKIGILPYAYNRMSFTLGIDSVDHVKTEQTGALDPTNNMYWDVTKGYIVAKLEGTSPKAPGGSFQFHIGGYSAADNVNKRIELLLPFTQNLELKAGKTSQVFITADAYDWFYNPHDFKLANTPVVKEPGELAKQVAENYRKMLTVDSVANEQ